MKLNQATLQDKGAWGEAGVKLPEHDFASAGALARSAPIWVHFGAGNIFRGFICGIQQRLLNGGWSDRGIIAAETFDYEIIDRIYEPYGNLAINALLGADGSVGFEVNASIAEAVKTDAKGMGRLAGVFAQGCLQIASFTITEKGYALRGAGGSLHASAESDMKNGPSRPQHAMGVFTALLLKRYEAGAHKLAALSLDNCSQNGDKLRSAVLEIAKAWVNGGFADNGFLEYVSDEKRVAFPWSMIDKITPRPGGAVFDMLRNKGIEGMEPIVTGKKTFIAPFVNAERPQYLVVEDNFPNGRPPFEKAGVHMTGREAVGRAEGMKVTACLNPLHTAMSIYGCLLGYKRISDEMKDPQIVALIKRLGYVEGLPVVESCGVISPEAFLGEVINERLPNPFIPDSPQRIASDTSQKVGARFGETIKRHMGEGGGLTGLVAVPLAIAGWLRYLLGVGDDGQPMEISPDPMKEELIGALNGVAWDDPSSYRGQALPILSNERIFGVDLTQTALGGRIEGYFISLLNGPGSVRETLKSSLGGA